MLINILVCMVLLLSGCSKKQFSTQKEVLKIEKKTNNMLDADINANESGIHSSYAPILKQKLETGISVDDVIQLALFNNLQLQADFEQLGLAKADLVQAGLLKNPTLTSQFKFPKEERFNTKIEANLIFSLSDLWQVGARKKVARDQLEIITLRISQLILDIYTQTKKAYNQCLFSHALYKNAQSTAKYSQAWRDRIYYRQKFGYTSDLDTNLADTDVDRWSLDVIHYKKELNNAYAHLRQLLGLLPSTDPIELVSINNDINIPQLALIEQSALVDRPEIQVFNMKIQQSKDMVDLERRKIVKDLDVGFAYERDFDNAHGRGFSIGFDVPLFDTNYAQIERAHILIEQAKKELSAQKNMIRKEVIMAYENVQAAIREVQIYGTMIKSYEAAVAYTEKYIETMQTDLYVALQTRVQFYEAKKMAINASYKLANAIVDLERAIGKKLTT